VGLVARGGYLAIGGGLLYAAYRVSLTTVRLARGEIPISTTSKVLGVPLLASDPGYLAFARWDRKKLFIVTTNLSLRRKESTVSVSPLDGFQLKHIYYFDDVLRGSSLVSDLQLEKSTQPVLALSGQDLTTAGLHLNLPPLGLSIFSTHLDKPLTLRTQPLSPLPSEMPHVKT